MQAYLDHITNYLLTQSWQIALLVLAVGAVSFLLKNKSAHIRYLLWLVVLAKCLVPPLFTLPLPVLPQNAVHETMLTPRGIMSGRSMETPFIAESKSVSAPSVAVVVPAADASSLTTKQWLALAWVAGVVVFTLFALTKALSTNRWLRRQRRVLPDELDSWVKSLFSALGLRTYPKLWLIDGIGQPFVWGLLRGSIYLPTDFVKIEDPEHRRGILGHEISHIVRFDAAVNLLQVIVQAIFWFHPFVWWANKRIRAEREKCCDEMVIARLGAKVRDYSTAIVNIILAEQKSTRPVPSLAVAGPVKNIEERIKTMLRPGKKFYKRPSLVAATIVLLLALLTVPMALVLTAQAQTKPTAEQKTEPAESLHQAAAAGAVDQVKLRISKGAGVAELLLNKGAVIDQKNEEHRDGRTPLHSAAWYGHKDVADVLIAKGANINQTDVFGQTPLHLAASYGQRFVPELLLAKGANVNAKDKAGNTPLHIAAGYWCVSKDLLELLIAKGADVKARNQAGQTPLHSAAESTGHRKHDDVVELLLANGADINAKDKSGCTPLYMVAMPVRYGGRKETAELLLSRGTVIDQKNDEGMTVLHIATMVGRRSGFIELLLNKGANVNATQSSGWTPLHYAAKAGYNDIAELLVSKGADVNAKTVRGETPAHLAAVQNHKDTVKLLISKGAEVSTIQLAAYIGDLAEVRSFIEKGISVNAQDGYLLTPLHAAAGTGQREVVEFLISKGAVVTADAVVEGPGTPLHYAADGGSKEVAELLIGKGASVSARNRNGETALHLAAQKGYTDMVRLFMASEANLSTKAQDGRTPLHYAAQNSHKDVALLFIDNGADVNAEDIDKLTPLDYAARAYRTDVAKLLIDKGADVSSAHLDDLLYHMCIWGRRDLAEFSIKKGADVNSKAWGTAPSFEALWGGQTDIPNLLGILKLLLDNGADPNAKDDRFHWSLLHYTAYDGRYADMTRLLLDRGANPNAMENEGGRRPLHLAAEPGHKANVELLISRGADVNAKDYYGRTPLSYAEDLGSNELSGPRDTPLTPEARLAKKEVAELLRKHGAKE